MSRDNIAEDGRENGGEQETEKPWRFTIKQRRVMDHIMQSLAINGPMTIYGITYGTQTDVPESEFLQETEEIVHAESSIRRWTHRLIIQSFVRVHEKKDRGTTYSLTSLCLAYILSPLNPLSERMWNRIDTIAEKNVHLAPILFGVWKEFKMAHLTDAIEKMLRKFPIHSSHIALYQLFHKETPKRRINAMDRWFLERLMYSPMPEYLKIATIIKDKPDVAERFFEFMPRLIIVYSRIILEIMEHIAILHQIDQEPTRKTFYSDIQKLYDSLVGKIKEIE